MRVKVLAAVAIIMGVFSHVCAAQDLAPRIQSLPELPPLGAIAALPGQNKTVESPHSENGARPQPGGKVIKQVLPDGSVVYSDRIYPGAKVRMVMGGTFEKQGIEFGVSSSSITPRPVTVLTKPGVEDEGARRRLAQAVERQSSAGEIRAGDRIFSGKKSGNGVRYSRLSPQYLERQKKAANDVAEAKAQLDMSSE